MQHRFGLIVGRVTERDEPSSLLVRTPTQRVAVGGPQANARPIVGVLAQPGFHLETLVLAELVVEPGRQLVVEVGIGGRGTHDIQTTRRNPRVWGRPFCCGA